MSPELMSVLGSIIVALLSINAYFFKDIVKTLKKIELEVMKLTTKHDRIEKDVTYLMQENQSLRERMHTIEGTNGSIAKYLELIVDEKLSKKEN